MKNGEQKTPQPPPQTTQITPAPATPPLRRHLAKAGPRRFTGSNRRRQADPGAVSAKAFAKSPSAGTPRIRALPELSPSQRPQNQSDLWPLRASRWPYACPATRQATAPISPGRQKSEKRGPAPRGRIPDLKQSEFSVGGAAQAQQDRQNSLAQSPTCIQKWWKMYQAAEI